MLPWKEEEELKQTWWTPILGLVLSGFYSCRKRVERKRERFDFVIRCLLRKSLPEHQIHRVRLGGIWGVSHARPLNPKFTHMLKSIPTLGYTHIISKSVFRLRPICTESKDLVRLGPDPNSAKNGQLKGLSSRQLWSQFPNNLYGHLRFCSDIR